MLGLIAAIIGALVGAFRPRALIVAENLALRQQLAVLRRKKARPRLIPIDRAFWILLSRVWSKWADALAIVKPETVIAWHRRGFASFWTRTGSSADDAGDRRADPAHGEGESSMEPSPHRQ